MTCRRHQGYDHDPKQAPYNIKDISDLHGEVLLTMTNNSKNLETAKLQSIKNPIVSNIYFGDAHSARNQELAEMALATIEEGHLRAENHHPEFDGELDCDKMFADRVAVHLQKEQPDGMNGWSLNPKFIPEKKIPRPMGIFQKQTPTSEHV